MRTLKSIKEVEPFDLYDITVENDHCFELENGVIAHNSLFPKDIVGGGCVVEGTLIQTPAGLKAVEDFQIGDEVYTLQGTSKVTAVWDPETLDEGNPECFEITFEDGYTVTCSENHKFYTVTCSENHKFLINGEWMEAKDLLISMDVIAI